MDDYHDKGQSVLIACIGIEERDFDRIGDELSPEAKRGVGKAVEKILYLINR